MEPDDRRAGGGNTGGCRRLSGDVAGPAGAHGNLRRHLVPLLLVIYHVIRRWMLIQRRRLAFDRAKHRRAEMLAQRARGEEEPAHSTSLEGTIDVDESEVDLDAISAQSLRLVRSILMLIALLSVIVLWSEIHSAFGFLENISLWDVTSTVQGSKV